MQIGFLGKDASFVYSLTHDKVFFDQRPAYSHKYADKHQHQLLNKFYKSLHRDPASQEENNRDFSGRYGPWN